LSIAKIARSRYFCNTYMATDFEEATAKNPAWQGL
jgi:hypothetical protein